jgi:hypothetical protein
MLIPQQRHDKGLESIQAGNRETLHSRTKISKGSETVHASGAWVLRLVTALFARLKTSQMADNSSVLERIASN